ncbi:MAG: TonB-dependent receptor, partial [Bacteroidota bacterium]
RSWYDSQVSVLNNSRTVATQNYSVDESIKAGYAMVKLEFGKKLSIIPGFRFEQSDNSYDGKYSTANGRYGVNGFIRDTTTFQKYGEFLPHLHIKFKPLDWFDIRASYAATLARPDFNFLIPAAQVDDTGLNISAGNPVLRHARSENYDLFLSAYKGGWGLLTVGGFYKNVRDIFIPWRIQLADQSIADANGWSNKPGYELSSYTNLPESTVYGFEVDLQTNLSFLPKPFNGLVVNANYAKLYSTTEVFFLTSESRLIIPFPPVFETTFTLNEREVTMPSQSPDIINLSFGYDFKGFSARVSGNFQGTKAVSYNLNKDFDRYTLEFWRWDMSVKQRLGKHWSLFLNINNFTNQQDVGFTREIQYITSVRSYGMTGTVGAQFKL